MSACVRIISLSAIQLSVFSSTVTLLSILPLMTRMVNCPLLDSSEKTARLGSNPITTPASIKSDSHICTKYANVRLKLPHVVHHSVK